jgi:DNA adenine methylase
VFVHHDCRQLFDLLRPHFADPNKASMLAALVGDAVATKPKNVCKVSQLSPFRYPGGKTWLVPEVRRWVASLNGKLSVFVEPFAGGAIMALTAAVEGWATKVHLSEIDADVAAVWRTLFHGKASDLQWLCDRIDEFEVSLESVRGVIDARARSSREKAFRALIKNRMQRGGIIAPGAGLLREGEAGKGLMSRWYPETLIKRINALRAVRNAVTFEKTDGFEIIERYAANENAVFFIDPPYTTGKKSAGRRLYNHCDVDHERLFRTMSRVAGAAMMTYDDAPEVREMARKLGFRVKAVPMKSTHHAVKNELLILKP